MKKKQIFHQIQFMITATLSHVTEKTDTDHSFIISPLVQFKMIYGLHSLNKLYGLTKDPRLFLL